MKLMSLWYSVELGLANGEFALWETDSKFYEPKSKQFYYSEVTLQYNIWNFYLGGRFMTPVTHNAGANFRPMKITYDFTAGFAWKWFDIGWTHQCTHPITAYIPDDQLKYKIEGAYDQFFIRVSGELKFAK